jgi:hypothetical protein
MIRIVIREHLRRPTYIGALLTRLIIYQFMADSSSADQDNLASHFDVRQHHPSSRALMIFRVGLAIILCFS